MSNWAIRRVSDGLFWNHDAFDWRPFRLAVKFSQDEHDANLEVVEGGLVEPGEEWVELDDAGQPVEVKAVRMWAMSVGTGYWYVAGSVGGETDELRKATLYTDAERDGMCARDRYNCDAVLVHPKGTVTLDEPAPAEETQSEECVEGYVVMRALCPAFLRCEPAGEREWRVLGYTDDARDATPLTIPDARSVAKAEGGLAVFLRCKSGKLIMVHGAPAIPAIAQPSPYSDTAAPDVPQEPRRSFVVSRLGQIWSECDGLRGTWTNTPGPADIYSATDAVRYAKREGGHVREVSIVDGKWTFGSVLGNPILDLSGRVLGFTDHDDEPIPYRLTDTDDRDNLIARIAVQHERAARHVRKAAKLEKRLAKVAP